MYPGYYRTPREDSKEFTNKGYQFHLYTVTFEPNTPPAVNRANIQTILDTFFGDKFFKDKQHNYYERVPVNNNENLALGVNWEPCTEGNGSNHTHGYYVNTTSFATCLCSGWITQYLPQCCVERSYNCTSVINTALTKIDPDLSNDLSPYYGKMRLAFDIVSIVLLIGNVFFASQFKKHTADETRLIIVVVETVLISISLCLYVASTFNMNCLSQRK